jgi:hypothetical protein
MPVNIFFMKRPSLRRRAPMTACLLVGAIMPHARERSKRSRMISGSFAKHRFPQSGMGF